PKVAIPTDATYARKLGYLAQQRGGMLYVAKRDSIATNGEALFSTEHREAWKKFTAKATLSRLREEEEKNIEPTPATEQSVPELVHISFTKKQEDELKSMLRRSWEK